MFAQVSISDGQVSGVDSLSPAASSVINWEEDEAGIARPRPRLVSYSVTNIGSSPVIGLEHWKNYIVTVHEDRTIRVINDAVPDFAQVVSSASSSTMLEGTKRPTFAQGDQHIYIAGGGRLQRWNSSLPYTELVTASPNCTHVAAMGQYLITNDVSEPGNFRWSDIGEGDWGTWPAANATNADARPDEVLAVFENTQRLYVYGSDTLQVYALGSDPSLPFDSVTAVNTGLLAPYAAYRMDETFAFADHRRRVVTGDGITNEAISTAIEKDIRDLSTVSDCWMYREEVGQHSRLVVRFPTERRTFVYSLKGQKWSERKYYSNSFNTADFPINAYAYRPRDNAHIVGLSTSGLAKLTNDVGSELSGPLVCERTTGWNDFGTPSIKRGGMLRFTLRRGTAATNATPGMLEWRQQPEDGPWSQWEQIDLGEPHEYEHVVKVMASAIFQRMRFGFRFSSTDDFSLAAVHYDVTDLEAGDTEEAA